MLKLEWVTLETLDRSEKVGATIENAPEILRFYNPSMFYVFDIVMATVMVSMLFGILAFGILIFWYSHTWAFAYLDIRILGLSHKLDMALRRAPTSSDGLR